MAFQPFGYSFEVRSTMRPEEAKAALRSTKKGWFETKNGPRGWIVGPVICLWASALDRHGPMLVGWISDDNFGTRVRGRAGSDLNGVAMAVLWSPILIFLLYAMLPGEAATGKEILLFGALAVLFVVGWPLMFWFGHKERRRAAPLVNFVRDTLGQSAKPRRSRPRIAAGPALPMTLVVCGDEKGGSTATIEKVQQAIHAILYDPHGFLVLQRDDQHYMQAARGDDGFVLEKREGSEAHHYVAEGPDGGEGALAAEVITEALLGYLTGQETAGVRWKRLFL